MATHGPIINRESIDVWLALLTTAGSNRIGLEALWPMANLSKTQIDRLGERLKTGDHSEADLQLLDEYRRSFGVAYEQVLRIVRDHKQSPSGRRAKSTSAIVEKLERESIRLSQMQDIAGCRVVVANVVEQDRVIATLRQAFAKATVTDRRDRPSSGYRAVHIIVEAAGRPVEIQVRTTLQHLWAELSERSADVLNPEIKYGGGPIEWQRMLEQTSSAVGSYETLEHETMKRNVAAFEEVALIDAKFEHDMAASWKKIFETLVLKDKAPIREQMMRLQREKHENLTKDLMHLLNAASIAEVTALREIWVHTAGRMNEMISALAELEGKKE